MKKIIIPVLLIFMSCNSKTTETTVYPFKGILIDVISSEHKMMIKHDEVPGFMMEMTMMFNIDTSIDINKYTPGDSLNFNFYILEQEEGPAKTWVNELKILGHRNLRDEETYDDFFDDNNAIQIGEKLSNKTFLDFNGQEVELSQWDGKFKYISFIFSRCPMPNFCPAVILKNQYLINQFKNNTNVEFIIISFDYKYDTPKVLKEAYGNIFDGYKNIHFLSSYNHKDDIINMAEEVGLGFSGIDDGDPREMYHTLKSLLISPEGILMSSYSGDAWLPKEVELNIKNRLKAYGMD